MKGFYWLIAIVALAIPFAYYYVAPSEKPLPIINPVDVNDSLVDAELLRKGFGHTIGDFEFLNQYGELLSSKDIDGKIWVAEYFFTTCGSICPKMNKQMQRVQSAFKGDENLVILSFTVTPEIDTVEQMKKHADFLGAELPQWQLLTGDKSELYSLARKSFFLLKPAEAENLGDAGNDFIHTNNFVLIDQERRIRGYYDGTNAKEVDKMIKDIDRLKEAKN
ncbi:MAG: SCO family protein [Bacteroidota bacterium]